MHAPPVADDNRLLRGIPAARAALIDRIARAAAAGGRTELRQRFLRAYFHGVAEEDLAERSPRELARVALAQLEFSPKHAAISAGRACARCCWSKPAAIAPAH